MSNFWSLNAFGRGASQLQCMSLCSSSRRRAVSSFRLLMTFGVDHIKESMTCFRALRGRHIIHCSNFGFIRPHEACLYEQMTNTEGLITRKSIFLCRQFEANLSCSLRDYFLICIVPWCSFTLYQQVIHDESTGLPSKQLSHCTMKDLKSEGHSKRVRRKLYLSNRELKFMSSEHS